MVAAAADQYEYERQADVVALPLHLKADHHVCQSARTAQEQVTQSKWCSQQPMCSTRIA